VSFEDFTTYTEVDNNLGQAVIGANNIDIDWLARDGCQVIRDFGASFWASDFTWKLKFTWNAGRYVLPIVGSTHSNAWNFLAQANKWSVFVITILSTSLRLYEYDEAGVHSDNFATASIPEVYYLEMEYDSAVGANGTVFLYIRTGSHSGALQDTLSLALHKVPDYRYVHALNIVDQTAPVGADMEVDDLDLGLGGSGSGGGMERRCLARKIAAGALGVALLLCHLMGGGAL
jgi:hypothetical protein